MGTEVGKKLGMVVGNMPGGGLSNPGGGRDTSTGAAAGLATRAGEPKEVSSPGGGSRGLPLGVGVCVGVTLEALGVFSSESDSSRGVVPV